MGIFLACATGKLPGYLMDVLVGFLIQVFLIAVFIPVAIVLIFLLVMLLERLLVALGIFTLAGFGWLPSADTDNKSKQAIAEAGRKTFSSVGQVVSQGVALGTEAGTSVWQRYLNFVSFFVRGYQRPRLVAITSCLMAASYWHLSYAVFGWFWSIATTLLVSSFPFMVALALQGGEVAREQRASTSEVRLRILRMTLLLSVIAGLAYYFRTDMGKWLAPRVKHGRARELAHHLAPPTLKDESCSKQLSDAATALEYYSVEHSGTYPDKLSDVGEWKCPVSGADYAFELWERSQRYKLSCPGSHWQDVEGFQEGLPVLDNREGWQLAPGLSSRKPPHQYVSDHGDDFVRGGSSE